MQKVKLNNIDCASCAAKIEKALNKHEDISHAQLNFSTSTLLFESSKKNILDSLESIIQDIEKGVSIEKETKQKKKSFFELIDKTLLLRSMLAISITYLAYNASFEQTITLILYVLAYLLAGSDVVLKALKNISQGRIFDENFLMSVATLGAFGIQDYVEAIAVMVFYQIGEMFQGVAVQNSRGAINELLDIKPEFATIKTKAGYEKVAPESVKIGDEILVKVGEKVPLDATLLSSQSSFDTSSITGEFQPKNIRQNQEVRSGYINLSKAASLRVTTLYKDSTVAKIIELIEHASSKKAKAEKLITKFAAIYTPIVVFLALFLAILPPLLLADANFTDWFERALIFLVISCPCALVVSIPLTFFSAIGAASKKGILIKGANYLEKLNEVKQVVFDKTGTLTHGEFRVSNITCTNLKKESFLQMVADIESLSSHPIANSITASVKEVNHAFIKEHEELSGYGLKAIYNGKNVLVGNAKLLQKEGVVFHEHESVLNTVYVAIDGVFEGIITVSDTIKTNAKEHLQALKEQNIKHTVMLSGDKVPVANHVATLLGIDETKAELLPQDKLKHLENLKKDNITAFVGDGMNDAPSLMAADVGIAMGGVGSDLAVKSADIVIMNDDLANLALAKRIAKKTKTIVYQNISFALLTKVLFLLLGAGAVISMKEAIFADVGVALLAILNAMRILKEEKSQEPSTKAQFTTCSSSCCS